MTSASTRLSRVLFASAAAILAAAPASAAGPAFLKLGGVEGGQASPDRHKDQIEILSWSWGDTSAKGGNVEFEWKVEEGKSAPPRPPRPSDVTLKRGTSASGGKGGKTAEKARLPVEREMKESGEKGGTEDINIGVGELQESPARGGVRVASGDVDGDGRADVARKRQHGWVTVSKPLDRGAVRVKVKMPWLACRVGARYPMIELGDGANSFKLHDVTVASCGGDADDRPTEEVAFYYNKIG